jgi:hypothetical protein
VDATLSYNGVDVLYRNFTLVHGIKTGQGAAKANLLQYGSGMSEHTHWANSWSQVLNGRLQAWLESGCMRTIDNIEYLPHGDKPDWANSFVSLTIHRETGTFFAKTNSSSGGSASSMGRSIRPDWGTPASLQCR